jgi:hypothetical protein
MKNKIRLTDYLDGMRAATTSSELEAAIQAPFRHSFRGRTWSAICKVRIEAGKRICAAHPNGRFIPRFGPRRRLTVCGQEYGVGRGQNSTGVRYVWHFAGEWAKQVLMDNGMSARAAHRIWGGWSDYPHRCLLTVEDALAGKIHDPEFNVLHRHERTGHGNPISYSVDQNNDCTFDKRATRPCGCGGTLFDWGSGYSEGFNFINWHCNKCPDVFTEYMTSERMSELRRRISEKADLSNATSMS